MSVDILKELLLMILRIIMIDMVKRTITPLSGLSSTSVGVVSEAANYIDPTGSNYLYLLRSEDNDVRKISRYVSGYSLPERRINPDARFAGAHDIEIDGKIY